MTIKLPRSIYVRLFLVAVVYLIVFLAGWQGWRLTGKSIAPIAGSGLKYAVEGGEADYFLVNYNFGTGNKYNHEFSYDLAGAQQGILHIEPYPERENVLIQVTAISQDGKKSDTITIRNERWWIQYSYRWFLFYFGRNFVEEHTFRFLL